MGSVVLFKVYASSRTAALGVDGAFGGGAVGADAAGHDYPNVADVVAVSVWISGFDIYYKIVI